MQKLVSFGYPGVLSNNDSVKRNFDLCTDGRLWFVSSSASQRMKMPFLTKRSFFDPLDVFCN